MPKPILTITAFVLSLQITSAQPAPKLLPFQGLLMNADGTSPSDGTHIVQFRLYNAPVAGTAVWPGETHRLSINGGLVSTLLGTQTSLAEVDFNHRLFLEITIDANTDNTIGPEDPPLLPRQAVLPSVLAIEAVQARTLRAGDGGQYDWTALFGDQSPSTGHIPGSRLAVESVTDTQIANHSITDTQLSPAARTPVGAVMPYAGTQAPEGWLLCNGTPYKRSAYPALFAVIGDRWRASHTSPIDADEFRVPDLRGRFLRGLDTAGLRDRERQGHQVGSLQNHGFQQHAHFMFTTAINSPEATLQPGLRVAQGGNASGDQDYRMRASGDQPTLGRTSSEGLSTGETRPMNAAVNYIIKH